VSIDSVLLAAGIPAEAVVVALLWWRRVYRQLPVFSAYLAWGLLSDCAMPVLQSHFAGAYIRIYLVESSLDSVLQYGVLVELAWAVLRPFHAMSPRRLLAVSALGVLLAGALAWPFSTAPEAIRSHWDYVLIVRLQQTFAMLRVALFVALAVASHWLTVGWRNRELQVATGLGVYSLVSLVGTLVHKHQSVTAPSYRWVEAAISVSYIVSLVYWVVSFAQKEPPLPAMPEHAKNVLSELAQTARGQRAAIEKRQRGGRDGASE
jgi:hypothetical protein